MSKGARGVAFEAGLLGVPGWNDGWTGRDKFFSDKTCPGSLGN